MVVTEAKTTETLEFRYTNLRPPAGRVPPSRNYKGKWDPTTTHVVRVWWDGEVLKYERRYVCQDGTVDATPIEHAFTGHEIAPYNVARNIHWGCCGWDAASHQIWQLRELIAEFLGETE